MSQQSTAEKQASNTSRILESETRAITKLEAKLQGTLRTEEATQLQNQISDTKAKQSALQIKMDSFIKVAEETSQKLVTITAELHEKEEEVIRMKHQHDDFLNTLSENTKYLVMMRRSKMMEEKARQVRDRNPNTDEKIDAEIKYLMKKAEEIREQADVFKVAMEAAKNDKKGKQQVGGGSVQTGGVDDNPALRMLKRTEKRVPTVTDSTKTERKQLRELLRIKNSLTTSDFTDHFNSWYTPMVISVTLFVVTIYLCNMLIDFGSTFKHSLHNGRLFGEGICYSS